MQIIIYIDDSDEDQILDLQAAGAKDMLEVFLPLAGIKATRVRIHHMTDENRKLMLGGCEYTEYSSCYDSK